VQTGRRETTLPIVLRTTELVAADAQGIRRLLSCHGFVPTRPPTSAWNRSSVCSNVYPPCSLVRIPTQMDTDSGPVHS
jgi:hypothetical protein